MTLKQEIWEYLDSTGWRDEKNDGGGINKSRGDYSVGMHDGRKEISVYKFNDAGTPVRILHKEPCYNLGYFKKLMSNVMPKEEI